MSVEEGNLLPRLKELVPIYAKVKEAIFLAEYEDNLELPLTSINELRNCLDHLMRTFVNGVNDKTEHEFIEAKAHLYRAGNDSYEILVMHKLNSLNEYKKNFDKEAIKDVFPDYYTTILPLVSKAKSQLSKIRSEKPVMDEEKNTFAIYENIVAQLMEQTDNFYHNSSGIIEYEKTMKTKGIRNRAIDWVIGGIVIGTILLFIQKRFF